MAYTIPKGKWIYKVCGAGKQIYIVAANATTAKERGRAFLRIALARTKVTAKRMPLSYHTNQVWLATKIRSYKLVQ